MGVLQASWWDCLNSLGISVRHQGQTEKKLVASRVKSCHWLKRKFIRTCLTMEFLSSLSHSTILYFAADMSVSFWGTMVLILNYSLPRTMIFKLFAPRLYQWKIKSHKKTRAQSYCRVEFTTVFNISGSRWHVPCCCKYGGRGVYNVVLVMNGEQEMELGRLVPSIILYMDSVARL